MKTSSGFLFFLSFLLLTACSETEDSPSSLPPGMYKFWKQERSSYYAFTQEGPVAYSSETQATNNTLNIIIKDFSPELTLQRADRIPFDSLHFISNDFLYIYPSSNPWITHYSLPHRIESHGDSLFIRPHKLPKAFFLVLSPLPKHWSVEKGGVIPIVINDPEEIKAYSTVRAQKSQQGIVVTSYDVSIRSEFTSVNNSLYYLDLKRFTEKLQKGDTLLYVKKESYYRK